VGWATLTGEKAVEEPARRVIAAARSFMVKMKSEKVERRCFSC
jgi:hypothetical protein